MARKSTEKFLTRTAAALASAVAGLMAAAPGHAAALAGIHDSDTNLGLLVEELKKRGELIERSFAHCYETGAMRRVYLRGRENILKR